MKKIVSIHPLPDYHLKLCFDDGVAGTVNLSRLVGKGVFVAWNDPKQFARVRLGDFGEPVWDGDIDLCPDALYLEVTGQTVEELFPQWKQEAVHA